MKVRYILLLAATAIVMLSFTFSSTAKVENVEVNNSVQEHEIISSDPLGGFLSEDQL